MPNNGIISRQAVIPDEFLVSSVESTDLVIINTPTTGNKVQQKAVPVSALGGGGGTPYKETFILFNPQGNNPVTQIYSTLSDPISVSKGGVGSYSLVISAADRPTSATKCQIISQPSWGNTGINGIYNLQFQTSFVASNGNIAFWVYRQNSTTKDFELVDLPQNLGLNIRFYN